MRNILIIVLCFALLFSSMALAFAGQDQVIKKLQLSQDDVVIAGVCGGLADYFGIDVALVRAGFIFFTLAGGAGILVYLVLWLVMN